MNGELPDVQAGFRKGRGIRDQIARDQIVGSSKKQESSRKTSTSAKAFDCVDHKKLWKILQEMEYQTTWPASWEICMQRKKQQLELDMEQQAGSK